jgi:hypothetical protein
MTGLLLSLLGYVIGPSAIGLGIWGIVLKLAARFGLSWITSAATGPVGSAVGAAAEGLVDLISWVVKGILGYIGAWLASGIDHISKSVPAAFIVLSLSWGAYAYGVHTRPAPEPQQTAAPAKPAPSRILPKLFSKASAPRAKPRVEEEPSGCKYPVFADQIC